ncbi:nucleotide exchange factor GrpE [Actinomadura rayongensis]|uniref:Nucleotide exchange factor GrpE n=1 Tax=Actinomadura rayongensis TaxID=1429076 RepID=A0A6I4WCM5_9ACTN|nr:nucleotide exchange factor GrpE [Actinomadura rayongensis]
MSSDPDPAVSADPASDPPDEGVVPPHEPPPEPPAEPPHGEILAALAALGSRLDREHERAAHREAVIDRLHEENQRLRRGELEGALEPLRAALYRCHDLARREARRWAGDEPPDPAGAAAVLAALADDIADALARSGVERFTAAPGEPYDASRHRPVAVETVADAELDGMITAVSGDGFERDGRVVRKAEVSVARTVPAARDAPAAENGCAEPDRARR